MNKFLGPLFVFILLQTSVAQNNIYKYPSGDHSFHNLSNSNGHIFNKISTDLMSKAKQQIIDYYPLSNNDFWEYLETDQNIFSVVKEVLGDTVLSNGLRYKKIITYQCANSAFKAPLFEYQRKDSTGKVYLFSNTQDKLLFDFTKNEGDTFSSPYPDHFWSVSEKYRVIGFNDTLEAVDLILRHKTGIRKELITFVQNFGMTYYIGDRNLYVDVPEGKFWGAVIGGVKYGDLISKEPVNWVEYYPLEVGNFWKYIENVFENVWDTVVIKILKDTLLADGFIYNKIQRYSYLYSTSITYFERIDSIGSVFEFDQYNQGFLYPKYQFSQCVGDTFPDRQFDYYWRIKDKFPFGIILGTMDTPGAQRIILEKGLGITEYHFEGSIGGFLIGALINDKVFGDTTITTVTNDNNITPFIFKLDQNFPNPFNSQTTIRYSLQNTSFVKLEIYDISGSLVKVLLSEEKNSGTYLSIWDGKDNKGQNVSSGTYFLKLTCNNNIASIKLLLLK